MKWEFSVWFPRCEENIFCYLSPQKSLSWLSPVTGYTAHTVLYQALKCSLKTLTIYSFSQFFQNSKHYPGRSELPKRMQRWDVFVNVYTHLRNCAHSTLPRGTAFTAEIWPPVQQLLEPPPTPTQGYQPTTRMPGTPFTRCKCFQYITKK